MTEIRFTDAVEIGKPRKTRDGYLTARVKAARTGIQDYMGSELGKPDLDRVRVYRPADEVFNLDSMGSFKGKPITDGHPKERVTADNHTALSRGHIAGVARDGEAVALDVAITDGSTVASIESGGPRELSVGYVTKLDWTPGIAPDGQAYDAVQRSIFVDHLAIVPNGRAGQEFRIGDQDADHWGASPLAIQTSNPKEDTMSDALISVVLGDKAVNVPAAQAPAIEAFKDASAKTLADTISTKDAEIADLKKQIETKDGEIKAKDKALADATSPAALQDAAKSYAKTTEAGKKAGLSEDEMSKMDDAAIRRAVVAKSLGDAEVKAMTDAAIEGAFAFAAKGAATQTNDAALGAGLRTQVQDGGWGSVVSMKKEA
ncbi:hypothetical protein A8B82_21130 [Sulfitobacter sp. EhC04]|uniref:DUF2213 domain-containing protein n=1 Tax=Sulfitobacter sp. EhC04 TaxID=1849168 RepID=UPI0007F3F44D|nr:DUF2213 domain-containing protein [Sulfitobacter sp. EhC04]OAN71099.1 hypothetical protein A8B82_21130 [Sulfitobacter sp. EhC04]